MKQEEKINNTECIVVYLTDIRLAKKARTQVNRRSKIIEKVKKPFLFT